MTAAGGPVLAVDAGQTGTKTRLVHDGAVLDERALPGVRTHEPLLPQLAAAAAEVARATGIAPAVLSAGVSGLTAATADAPALLELARGAGVRRVLLAHDSITSFLGTLATPAALAAGDVQGVVIAAGTGVVTLGVGAAEVARVDGWGNIMGDAGSGYWIGREALEAGMRDFDGRGPTTAITALLRAEWPDLTEAYIQLQGADDRVARVAAFAAPVAALAETGDAVAADICARAAVELACSVHTALRRTGLARPAPAALPGHGGPTGEASPDAGGSVAAAAIGGVFRSAVIRGGFERLVLQRYPEVRFEAAYGTGLDGAVALSVLPPAHALRTHVATAASAISHVE